MRILFLLSVAFLCMETATLSQVSINTDNNAPDPSAMLDVKSTDKGVLLPRLTLAQILTISNPANGLILFCTTDNKFYAYVTNAGVWKEIPFGPGILVPPFACGTSLVVNHSVGAVAPVDKTVTYGTATNIPGETSKCWITSNLGASQQAASVSDATEASSGWYWQFNRKQGYKHDGTTLTPAWTVTAISEGADWITANDPCNVELGSTWHVPTCSEWYNIDNTGGWNTWTGPWNSGLKLHGGGFLDISNGSLHNRGLYGYYWSSMQGGSTQGCHLNFDINSSVVNNNNKAYGFTLRCVRE